MINFRFHIVSLTAVLLALGIGLVLGTTILDTATVDVLRSRLEGLDHDLRRAEERNARQQQLIGDFEREADELRDEAGERLVDGELSGAPVLVIAPRDVDEGTVDQVMGAVQQAGGNLLGAWWLSERLALGEEGDVTELGVALELATADTERLHDNLVGQLADILFAASDASDESPLGSDQGQAEPATDARAVEPVLQQPPDSEPQVLTRLREHGFIEYDLPEGAEGDTIGLPSSQLRVVIVSGPEARLAPDDLVVPVLRDVAASGPVPVVVAESTPEPVEPDEAEETEQEPTLVQLIRDDDRLAERVATVDNLDRATGVIATILAVADADPAAPRLGHYGSAEDASHLLPPTDEVQAEDAQ
jgi:hypothetical protein